jgi:hypothetical protein
VREAQEQVPHLSRPLSHQSQIQREKLELDSIAIELQELSDRLVENGNEVTPFSLLALIVFQIQRKEQCLEEYEKSLAAERSQLQNHRQEIQFKEQEVSMIYEQVILPLLS